LFTTQPSLPKCSTAKFLSASVFRWTRSVCLVKRDVLPSSQADGNRSRKDGGNASAILHQVALMPHGFRWRQAGQASLGWGSGRTQLGTPTYPVSATLKTVTRRAHHVIAIFSRARAFFTASERSLRSSAKSS
jgi:hypothetical protein